VMRERSGKRNKGFADGDLELLANLKLVAVLCESSDTQREGVSRSGPLSQAVTITQNVAERVPAAVCW